MTLGLPTIRVFICEFSMWVVCECLQWGFTEEENERERENSKYQFQMSDLIFLPFKFIPTACTHTCHKYK